MSHYRREFLFIDEGQDRFHEMVHYWQHAGTTFGTYQMIGHLIINKALNISLRKQIEHKEMDLPLTLDNINELFNDLPEDSRAKKVIDLSQSLFRKESENSLNRLKFIPESPHTFYSGNPDSNTPPYLKATRTMGYEIGALSVMEFHNYVINKSMDQGHVGRAFEETLFKLISQVFGEGLERQIAFICDWALMVPNKHWTQRKIAKEEFHPGWRLLLSLERLNRKNIPLQDFRNYDDLVDVITGTSNWMDRKETLRQYETYIEFVDTAGQNEDDANRNRQSYRLIGHLAKTAYQARLFKSDMLALPHLNEEELYKRLPPLAIRRGNSLFLSIEENLKIGYLAYITNLAHLKQFYNGTDAIQCFYHYLKITGSCRYYKSADLNNQNCFAFPGNSTEKYIDCPFMEFWEAWLQK
ncbi:MAG: hypothetical protein QNJ57_12965 [Flavobacteriaceae bacterium]|nr:hypothetical protein [Flavobacteriaceae bacterium]